MGRTFITMGNLLLFLPKRKEHRSLTDKSVILRHSRWKLPVTVMDGYLVTVYIPEMNMTAVPLKNCMTNSMYMKQKCLLWMQDIKHQRLPICC